MHTIILASNNLHKVEEIQAAISHLSDIRILSLKEAGIEIDIDETGTTLEENAQIKAQAIYELTGAMVLADDSGLEVNYLNGAPGVKSARYAGIPPSDQGNISKLLKELKDADERSACFRTVLCFIHQGMPYFFEGIVEGEILRESKGSQGFGYDPVFLPVGKDCSFAEMSLYEKNQISHRSKALKKFVEFLEDFVPSEHPQEKPH